MALPNLPLATDRNQGTPMKTIVSERSIAAPLDFVFRTVSEIENFSKALPKIAKVEFVSETRSGVGTRFRETRVMGKRQATTTLEVVECVPNDRIRLIADEMGTVWDSTFHVREREGMTILRLTMEARPRKWTSRVFLSLIRGMIVNALEDDMDAVKVWCERRSDEEAK